MNLSSLIVGSGFYLLAHIAAFYQLQGQFLWEGFKNNPFLLALFGVPISYLYLLGTKHTIEAFGGQVWPNRFIVFAIGIMVYAVATKISFGQSMNTKTLVSLGLSVLIILVQLINFQSK